MAIVILQFIGFVCSVLYFVKKLHSLNGYHYKKTENGDLGSDSNGYRKAEQKMSVSFSTGSSQGIEIKQLLQTEDDLN